MTNNGVETFQSFCRRYVNKAVRNHFRDVAGTTIDSLSLSVPREAIKRVCLHEDKDPLLLTIARLLIWWVEARGLMEEFIYGIPASNLHESVRFKPQIKLFWRETAEDAKLAERYPIRAQYTVRYRGDYASRADLERLKTKLTRIFNTSKPHSFTKGREKFSYRDKEKGYEFIITAQNETEAKDVINKLLSIQDDAPLNEALLTRSIKEKNWNARETVRVAGEVFTKPKERPIGKVHFTHAELAVHGMAKDKTLISNLATRVPSRLE